MENHRDYNEEKEIENIVDGPRVMNFSDAIFAFAATLLVLKIDLPILSSADFNTELPMALFALWPQYLANIITFFVIGHYWLVHHAVFGRIKRLDKTVVWLNILCLIAVAFLPFPVDLYGTYNNIPIVIAFYSGALAVVGLLLAIIWIYASDKHRLIDKNLSQKKIDFLSYKYLVAPVVFGIAIPLAFIHPIIAQLAWIFVILGIVFIEKIAKKVR